MVKAFYGAGIVVGLAVLLVGLGLLAANLKGGSKPGVFGYFVTGGESYSNGDRAGYLQKFSHKGVLGYWEGAIILRGPDTSSDHEASTFFFNVDSGDEFKEVRDTLSMLVGQEVKVTYDEKYISGLNSSSNYWVIGVEPVKPIWVMYPYDGSKGAAPPSVMYKTE